MTYLEKQSLNALSKECFGTASRWKKLIDYGVAEEFEREREVMLPRNGEMVKKVFKDKKYIVKHYTVDEVRKLMEDILEKWKAMVVQAPTAPEVNFVTAPGAIMKD